MMKPEKHATALQRAVSFFQQPAWIRLFDAIYHKYMAQGSVQGKVLLQNCTSEELREIARFLDKPIADRPDLTVSLADIQKALNESSLACPLPDLLRALYPQRSHTTRALQRQRKVEAQQTFAERLTALADDFLPDSRGKQWFLTGEHGREALYRRYKNETAENQNQFLHSFRLVLAALQQLPEPEQSERLALFAERISGDPHCFDVNTLSGRLLHQALSDLSKRNQAIVNIEDSPEPGDTSLLLLPEQEQQRFFLYAEFGLLIDTLSSTVAVFHLTGAEISDGQMDSWMTRTGERILVLPLRQILAWHKVYPASEHVYLFENPQVFEKTVDILTRTHQSGGPCRRLPTLICTSGWPSVAAFQLLTTIINAAPNVTFHYSGDFDLRGLQIAAHLLARYSQHCRLWHFDPPSYFAALHPQASKLESNELSALKALPPVFASLVTAMQEQGKKAYQEGIVSLLLNDIHNSLV